MQDLTPRAALAGGAILVAGIAALAWPPLREYVYRELSYQVLLSRVAGDEQDPRAVTRAVMSEVHATLYPGGGVTIDTDPWTHLVRGIGWCDQQVWTVGTLLSVRGMESRMVMLYDDAGVKQHTALEVFLDGAWRLADPQYNLLFAMPDGSLATLQDVSSDPDLVVRHPVVQALAAEARQQVIEQYAAVFPLRREPEIWSSIRQARRANAPKALLTALIDQGWRVLGQGGASAFQDLYLAWLPRTPEGLYARARNYHLYGRFEQAWRGYQELAASSPASSYAEQSRLWAGVAAFQMGRTAASIGIHQEFLDVWPESRWKSRAYDQLAQAAEAVGDVGAASQFASLALRDPFSSTASRRLSERVLQHTGE